MEMRTEAGMRWVDVLPMVRHYMKSIGVYDVFDKYVPSSERLDVTHAECLCVIIENIICGTKPLYKVEEWVSLYADGPVDEPVKGAVYNDDRLARSLSKLHPADRHSIMTQLSVNAIKAHDLMTDEFHNDTTTITFTGKYEDHDPACVMLSRGHNKDHRPDCKQIVFGLSVTADGHVPLLYKAYDGNTSDDTTHVASWNEIRELIKKNDFIYVADCKLASNDNLKYIHQNNGRFVTLLPKNRLEVKRFHEKLKSEDVEWQIAYKDEDSRKKGNYITYKTYEGEKSSQGYRVIWVHSSAKAVEDKKFRERKIDKTLAKLEELSGKLNRGRLKTNNQINTAVNRITDRIEGLVQVKVVEKRVKVKASPGRPGPKSKYTWSFTYGLEWSKDESAIEMASRTDGIFPLTSNTTLEASEVLKTYKRQPYLEKRISTMKSILEIAPVFLKKEERIEAILLCYAIALMIVTLIERRIRLNMEKEKIEKLAILPQGMRTKKPTWNNIRYFFRNVHLIEIYEDERVSSSSVRGITELHKMVLRLLEVPESCYIVLKEDWWKWTAS